MKNLKFVLSLAVGAITLLSHGAVTGYKFTTLASFNDTNNGANPYAPPEFGADGRLYGALPYGGVYSNGVLFAVSTNGTQSSLFVFTNGAGVYPVGSLLSGQDGLLYGTASGGGSNNAGTIYKISTNGEFTLLYDFGAQTNAAGYSLDGINPYGGLMQTRDGNIYGTTYEGGVSNLGTIFQFSTNGTFATLHSFIGTDGAHPYTAALVEGPDGLIYGTTSDGGVSNNGTIFQFRPDGTLTNLFSFTTNGVNPYAGLAVGQDGCLYGTTVYGGPYNYGIAFRLTTNGVFTRLHAFGGGDSLYYPEGGLTPGSNDDWYGACYSGGAHNSGALFLLTTNGLVSTLYSFSNSVDGANPYAGLIRDPAGNLYGTALYGGKAGGYGTVFSWSDPTRPSATVTAPTGGQRSLGAGFTAAGKASDNVGTAAVLFSLNGSDWTKAVTTNHWSNWTAQVTLVAGTNRFQAFAVDYSGNASTTNAVNFDSVVTNRLTVRTVGSGSILPNYSNAWLEIGRNYSITSAPRAGFAFTSWTVSTNWGDGPVFTRTNLSFMMGSNLTLQASFADVAKPAVSFTTPTAGQKMTNALANLTGKATDNTGVAGVWYQLNGSGWSAALTTNSFTNWNAPLLTLVAGTNTIGAYAADLAGNLSATGTVSFVSSNTFKLQMNLGAAQALTATGLNFSLALSPHLSGRIQVSTNLSTWQSFTNFGGTNTLLNFHDAAATNFDRRFYRAVIP